MPFVFAVLGLLFLVVAIQGTQSEAFTLIKGEFTGSNSFVVFAAAIAILGALAYIKPFRPIALSFIMLVVLVMVLANKGGFFAQFNAALRAPVTPTATPVASTTATTAATAAQPAPVTSPAASQAAVFGGVTTPSFAGPGMLDSGLWAV